MTRRSAFGGELAALSDSISPAGRKLAVMLPRRFVGDCPSDKNLLSLDAPGPVLAGDLDDRSLLEICQACRACRAAARHVGLRGKADGQRLALALTVTEIGFASAKKVSPANGAASAGSGGAMTRFVSSGCAIVYGKSIWILLVR